MPRPSAYSVDLGIEIAARSAEGQSLKTICLDEDMPSLRAVQTWRHVHPEFDAMLMRAHLDKADLLFEEQIAIADEAVADTAQVLRNKLRVHARQWVAARLNPTKYAERLGIDATVAVARVSPSSMAPLEIARRIAFTLESGRTALQQQHTQDSAPKPALVWSGPQRMMPTKGE